MRKARDEANGRALKTGRKRARTTKNAPEVERGPDLDPRKETEVSAAPVAAERKKMTVREIKRRNGSDPDRIKRASKLDYYKLIVLREHSKQLQIKNSSFMFCFNEFCVLTQADC